MSLSRVRPGQLVTFNYPRERSNPRGGGTNSIPRLVLVLNRRNSPTGMKLHGLNLEHVPWLSFRAIMKTIVTHDTLTLIKRRLEIRAPINELIDRPMGFYQKLVRPRLIKHLCYRTYFTRYVKVLKLGALDYKTMFAYSDTESRSLLIEKTDKVVNIPAEQKILTEIIDVATNKFKDARFKKIILDRFGSIKNFVNAVKDIEKYVEETAETPDDIDFGEKR